MINTQKGEDLEHDGQIKKRKIRKKKEIWRKSDQGIFNRTQQHQQ